MKTIRLMAAALLFAAVPATTEAQIVLKHAITTFVNDKDLAPYIHASNSMENTEKNGVKTKSFYNEYSFDMPKSKRKELDKVLEAFKKDIGQAYKVQSRDAGISKSVLSKIAYGENLDKTVSFGSYKDRNYRLMFVRDHNDSLRRYAYAIVWAETANGDSLRGSITEIYGRDPQKDNSVTVIRPFSSGMRRITTINADGAITVKDTETGKEYKFESDIPENNKIETGMDFIKRFTSLRTTYISPELSGQKVVKATLANKIVELCREHGKLLNKEERSVCIKALQELRSRTLDNYEKDLFVLAISSLSK